MWRVGQDPTLRMTLGALVFLDRPPEPAALRERLALAVDHAPRLSQRPDEFGGFRGRPLWIDDEPILDAHVRELSIAAPGSRRQVLDLVGLLETVPFDPQRSPWDVTVIDGLAGGGAAMYVRAHHVLTDGVAGLRLLGLLLDEPGWPRTEPNRTPYTPPSGLARIAATSARSARSRSRSTLRRRSAACSAASVPPASSIRWRRRWVACSARWTSPTPCPVSSSSPEGRSPHARPVARCCRASS